MHAAVMYAYRMLIIADSYVRVNILQLVKKYKFGLVDI